MIFCEDLQKNLEICVASKSGKTDNLVKWYDSIGSANLHEREEYQKKTELLLLNTLFQHYPEMEIENLTGESPDFIINYKGNRIGIEVSEIINHFELKKKESYINHIFRTVEKLLSEYKSLQGIYHLNIDYFQDDFYNQPEQLIKEISSAITNNKKTKFVRHIRRTPHQKGVLLFLEYQLSLFDELHSDKILEVIEKKNTKYPLYNSKTKECWLVLVSNMHNIASRYSYIYAKEELKKVKSPFTKILHLENLYSQMMVIK
ncbi:hypothetical protein [Epilithonimonas arachidiradicis]|uniref:Uncharacterized protein n=1 Tax=Epilithonimonas arachidiradicis TaxID=1617282 RepID=A0A420DBT0_9FLAO|nr:hypothetical protein [Epilithonimonas arachidiradicis]RKE88993.1 hypothetical protein BXY58_1127 [Epilithonimonas arachidiradicis]GGG53393.1 hypothetical protein GCM10007332_13850 [Epilithonimonas arachidiradicis]